MGITKDKIDGKSDKKSMSPQKVMNQTLIKIENSPEN